MSEFSNQYLTNSNNPKKLLVFLHGYNNTWQEMAPIYQYLLEKTPNLAIIVPEGKFPSQKEPERKSWYKISGFDAGNKRLQKETSVAEIAEIYNQAGPLLAQTAHELNQFITSVQSQYGFNDAQTYIGGFSQGAMLAIWTALIRPNQLAGCFSFSGLAAANENLNNQLISRPTVYLLHGKKDKQVLFKCLDFTASWLKTENVPVVIKTFDGLEHEVSNDELDFAAEILGIK